MNPEQFESFLSRTLEENPNLAANCLTVVSRFMESYREKCKRENDSDLRAFAEVAFPYIVETLPKVGKNKGDLFKRILKVEWLYNMFKRLKFDSPSHCVAVKEAWVKYEKL